jgi:hypothetical protein
LPIEGHTQPIRELLLSFDRLMDCYGQIPEGHFGFVRLAVFQCLDKLFSMGYDSIKVRLLFRFVSFCLF